MSRIRPLIVLAGVALTLGGLYTLTGEPSAAPDAKTAIDVWHPWPGDAGEEFRRLVDVFNASHDSVHARLLYVPNNLSSSQKLFLSISAGSPPDCTFVDGPQVCEWAARGAIEPLDRLMTTHGVNNDDFWGPCVRQNRYRDKTFAITYCADPNFAFLWNREVFRMAGLDPERPPQTIEDLDRMARALTTRDENGRITRIGFIPWNVFGYANSIFTWGWAFGGRFFDYEDGRVVCGEDPGVLEALEWMKSYADEYGFEQVNSFVEGMGEEADSPFIRGKIAMAAGHISNIKLFRRYAPNLDYGVCSFPYPSRMAGDHSAWMGGWCLAVPRGAEHPDDAFEFIKWLCTSEEAGRSTVTTTETFPGYMRSPAFDLVKGKVKLEEFHRILRSTEHQRPVMPAQAFFMGALERAVPDVLIGRKTPADALMRAQKETQRELDRVLSQSEI